MTAKALSVTADGPPVTEKLAYNKDELCAVLGVSPVTLWRLEKRGLLRPVPGIRHKLYSRKVVEAFLAGATT